MSTQAGNIRYSDMLYVEQPAEQTRNAVGDLVETKEAEFVKWGYCREEPNGGGRLMEDASGTMLAYESEVYLHSLCSAVPVNSCIKVFNAAGIEVLHGRVKRYKRYKHYAKIWV